MSKHIKKILLLLTILFITGCSTETITNQPGNYKYKIGEQINIIDIDTRNSIGTITITGVEILWNEQFLDDISEHLAKTGNVEKAYKTTYHQIIQIYYQYTTTEKKKYSGNNFTVYDSKNYMAIYATELTTAPQFNVKPKDGHDSFTVALKNKSEYVDIEFNYKILQTKPTAKIRIEL